MKEESPRPEGLFYFENIYSQEFVQIIERWWRNKEVQYKLTTVGNSLKSRKILQYGYKYDYSSGHIFEKTEPFPHIIEIICHSILKIWKEAPVNIVKLLNQCIINRYLPGQGIGSHIDNENYGSVIICFTFLSGREMEFSLDDNVYKLYTQPNSVYIMTGDSRWRWKHQMRPRKKDGNTHPRGECFSVTFREVNVIESH